MSKETIKKRALTIVGGGPAGLACAYYAQVNNLDYQVIEAGQVGESWLKMSRYFKLITPMWTNHLPSDRFQLNPFKKISCNEYGLYLSSYAKRKRLNIIENCRISKITKLSTGFEIQTSQGVALTEELILATGYYESPSLPSYHHEIRNSALLCFHARDFDFHYPSLLPKVGKILIVGKRNTAGQIAAQLINDNFDISFSVRSEIEFRNDDTFRGKIKEFLYFYWELFLLYKNPNLKQNSYPPMDAKGVKEFYQQGLISEHPEISSICENLVTFSDGSSSEFAAVIYATGYDLASRKLPIESAESNLTSASSLKTSCDENIRGLHHIGVDNMINFRSRYLRGIRCDAKKVISAISSQ
jgi:putative flavoprotein involved in K+ transport